LDKGIIKATFVLVSKNMAKGFADIRKNIADVEKDTKRLNKTQSSANKTLSETDKIHKDLEKSMGRTAKQVKADLEATKLSEGQKNKFIDTVKRLNNDLKTGETNLAKYNRTMRLLGESYGLVYKNGHFFDKSLGTPQNLSKVNQQMQNYIKTHNAYIDAQKRGLPITSKHKTLLEQYKPTLAQLDSLVKSKTITQSMYNNVVSRLNGSYEKLNVTTGKLNRNYGTLANATNMITRSQRMQNYAMQVAAMRYNALGLAVGVFSGMILGQFTYEFMMARTQSIKLDQQMQQFFKTMRLGKGAFQEFNKALDDYVAKAPKVNKYTLGSTIAQVGKLNNLSLNEMKRAIPVIADIQNMMQLNGRTAEDTMLAINDAFDGQFKRLQEIGVQGKEQLKQYGYDGSAMSLITALEKLDKEKGWSDLTRDISTAQDAFMVLGNAIDRIIVPAINLLTPAIVAVSTAVAGFLNMLNSAPPIVQALATVLMVGGSAFAFMKAQMWWAKTVGSEFMANLTGLDVGMQRMNTTMLASREVVKLLPEEFESTARSLAELNYDASKTGTKWVDLREELKDSYIQVERANLAYQSLDRTQKAQVHTLMRMEGISRQDATLKLLNNRALEEGIIITKADNVVKEQGLWASMKATYWKTLETGATTKDSGAKGANTLATTINTQAKNIGTLASQRFAQAQLFLTSTLTLTNIALLGLVAVIIAVGWAMTESSRKSAQAMKEYNNFLENGEEEITKLKDASNAYKTEAEDLEKVRDRMKKEGKNTEEIELRIAQAHQKSAKMAKEAKDAEEALKRGREQKKKIDAEFITSQSTYNQKTLDMMKESGYISQKQYEDGKKYNEIVLAGYKEEYGALQAVNRIRGIGQKQLKDITSGQHAYSKAFKKDAEEGGTALTDRVKAFDELAQVRKEMQTSDSIWTRGWDWGVAGVLRLKIGIIDTQMQWKNFCMSVGKWWDDTTAYIEGAWKNTVAWFSNGWNQITGFFSNIGKQIGGAFGGVADWFSGIFDGISKWFSGLSLDGVADWLFTQIKNGFNQAVLMFAHYNPITLLIAFLFGNETGYRFQEGIMNMIYGSIDAIWNGINWIYTQFMEGMTIIYNGAVSIWNTIVGYITGVWNYLVGASQNTWNWIYINIYNPLNKVWTSVVTTFNAIRAYLAGVWTSIVSTVTNAWNTVKNTIVNALNTVWSRVAPIVNQIKSAFNTMKNSLVASAQAIKVGVWDKFLKPLYDKLVEFWNFITHPTAGGGSPKAGSPSAGKPTGAGFAGSPNRSSPRTQISSHNNLFAGFGNTIKNTVLNAIDGSGIPDDPRWSAGNPLLSAGRLIKNPYECRNEEECVAGGWDVGTSWINSLKNIVSKWSMNILGTSTNIIELANTGANLKLFSALASKLIGGTRYSFYYGDGKSNAQALRDRSFNCYDGAQILIDLARGMGLKAGMGHGYWGGYRHVWAVVNGVPFDTTAFQHGYGWTSPQVKGYGSPTPTQVQPTCLKVEVNINGDIHGIEDYERRMTGVAHEVFNKLFGGTNPLVG